MLHFVLIKSNNTCQQILYIYELNYINPPPKKKHLINKMTINEYINLKLYGRIVCHVKILCMCVDR